MKKIFTAVLAIVIVFAGLNTCAFAKKAKSDTSTKPVKEKVKKEKTKTQKVKAEKPKKEKVKKEKVRKEKASKTNKTNEKKVSEKKTQKTRVKDLSQMTQVERERALLERASETKKRSALAMKLNPNLDITEIRASHILVKKRKDAVAIRKDIKEGRITFEEAAKQYSLCPTGVNGGDLGYFNRNRMDQQFTDRAFDLKLNELSEPVGTKFGWHLIKVVDKR